MDDLETYTGPWTAAFPTNRDDVQFEYACHEGNYSVSNALGGCPEGRQADAAVASRKPEGGRRRPRPRGARMKCSGNKGLGYRVSQSSGARDRMARNDEAGTPQGTTVNIHVVGLVHGIRTKAKWITDLRRVLEKEKFVVAPTDYGRMGLPKFLLHWGREEIIKKVHGDLQRVTAQYPNCQVSIIAHSFGTRVAAEIVKREAEALAQLVVPNRPPSFRHLILCGSVLKREFDMTTVKQAVDRYIVNEVATKDIWVKLIGWTGLYGATGAYAFNHSDVQNRTHHGYRHSDCLCLEFWKSYWIPLLKNNTLVPAARAPRRSVSGMVTLDLGSPRRE